MVEPSVGRDELARRRGGLFRMLAGVGIAILLLSLAVVVATVVPASASSGATSPTLAKACGKKNDQLNAYLQTGSHVQLSLMNRSHRQYESVK